MTDTADKKRLGGGALRSLRELAGVFESRRIIDVGSE
jgi:hypothetical protein